MHKRLPQGETTVRVRETPLYLTDRPPELTVKGAPHKAGTYFARSSKVPAGWAKDSYDLLVWVTDTAPFLRIYRTVDANTLESVSDVFRSPEVWGPELKPPRMSDPEVTP